jgi:glycosyltransferase involved in cell wall biosynthesis
MPEPRLIHAITPGDHFSPLTGSAIPTVVDGIARAAGMAGSPRQAVLVEDGTYPERHDSADAIEYPRVPWPSRADRYADRLTGALLRRRFRSMARSRPLLAQQGDWAPSVVAAHNQVELVGLVDARRHRPLLYAHNELLRTYSHGEARRTLGRVEHIVCVSDFLADLTSSRLPESLRSRVATVRNGVDCDRFHPAPSPRDDGDPRDPRVLRVLFVGRVIPDKGADVLLEALARLGRADVAATVVGSAGFAPESPLTDHERSLREIAGRVAGPVEFVSFTPRAGVADLLRSHDVMVVPSRWREPATLTVGEGLASGLPVVASRVGGIPEVVAHPELLVPPDDPRALAATLEWLVTDPDARVRLGRESREHALAHDWRATWRALSSLLAG